MQIEIDNRDSNIVYTGFQFGNYFRLNRETGEQTYLNIKHELGDCAAVVVAAGLEGALPSVVGGWLDCPVIAAPTSVGYGSHFGGMVPLLAMLNGCAANVTVVNIDAGFKGAYVAGLIAGRAARREDET